MKRERDYTIFDKRPKQKSGRPWKTIGKFDTFESADILRNGVLSTEEKTLDVKVKKHHDGFVVKSRQKEEEHDNIKKGKRRTSKKENEENI